MGSRSLEATTTVTPRMIEAAIVRARYERAKEAQRVFSVIGRLFSIRGTRDARVKAGADCHAAA